MMELLMLVKSTNVLLNVKTLGEMNTVTPISDMSTVHLAHLMYQNVKVLGTVLISPTILKKLWPLLIPTVMVKSTMVITLMKICTLSSWDNVTLMETIPLMLVKSSIVLLNVKTLGELITAQNLNLSTVLVHYMLKNAQVLGSVKISITSP